MSLDKTAKTISRISIEDDTTSLTSSKIVESVTSQTTIEDLPNTVLVKIFSNFKEGEICNTIIPVSRKWSVATEDASLWKEITFEGNGVPFDKICKILRSAEHLKSIILRSVPNTVQIIRQICRCNKKVKQLTVKHCEEHLTSSCLHNLIVSCSELDLLDLKGTSFSPDSIYEDLHNAPNLKSVSLTLDNLYFSVDNLIEFILNTNNIEELKLFNCIRKTPLVFSEMIPFVIQRLTSTLKHLKLDCLNLSPSTYAGIAECTKLEKLYLKNATELLGKEFIKFPKSLRKLSMLKLEGAYNLKNENIVKAFRHDTMKQITVLGLRDCSNLRNVGLITILNACGKNLTWLSVQGCDHLTENSMANIFTTCKQLKHLNLAFISDNKGKKYSEKILAHLEELSCFIIDQEADKDDLMTLQQQMPSLTVIISKNKIYKEYETVDGSTDKLKTVGG